MRVRGLAALLLMVGLAGGGCDDGAGDGSFTPQMGACHRFDAAESGRSGYDPVGCDELHEAETVHVGVLTASDDGSRPEGGSPARRAAFDACDAAATGYLGGEWRAARLVLRVVVPTVPDWDRGDRWFRCDLSEIGGMEFDDPTPRKGSLRAALADTPGGNSSAGGRSGLAYGCLNVAELPDGEIGGVAELDSCDTAHHAEYAGVWRAPDQSYADLRGGDGPALDGCRAVVARYLSVPEAGDLDGRVEVVFRLPPEQEWGAGDRGVRCILWLPDHGLTRSLRGVGPAGLPPAT
ncbi:septum formation family protein [Micromonospora echinofusca]|uniref:Septum formation-related domain-containing protein n=1 Tax=Micromonospora echinofusca TaxID=47858 RepID=A0ABS3VU97_MICEH|nr:septum formation family protein [Micromonospora echinofusca]MBO4208117.1 hypothetical protein [Micromonospora echinofusca]